MVLTIERFSKNQANVPTNGIQRFDGDDCEKKEPAAHSLA
jgi:hypothetical protein